jgi:chromosome segregation ATPase
MSTMLVEVYDALKEAGASEEKARALARDDRFDEVDKRLQYVEQRLGLVEQGLETLTRRVAALEEKIIALAQDVAVIRAELGLMKWMHGITIGGVLALLLKTFFG